MSELPTRLPDEKKAVAAPRTGILVPSIFLCWGIFGMVRPMFDASQSYEPIFWAVAGASLLTLYGRFHTKGLEDVDDEDVDEPLEDKWRFQIPHLFKDRRK